MLLELTLSLTREDRNNLFKVAEKLACIPNYGAFSSPSIMTLARRIARGEILVRRVGKFPARPNGVEKLGKLRHEQCLQRRREAAEKARAEAEGKPSDPKEKSVLDQTLES